MDGFTQSSKKLLVSNGARWLSFPKRGRAKIWSRFQRWQSMSGIQKETMASAYEAFQNMPDNEKMMVINAQQHFINMSLEKKQIMLKRFKEFQMRERPSMTFPMGEMDHQSNMDGVPFKAMPFNSTMPSQ